MVRALMLLLPALGGCFPLGEVSLIDTDGDGTPDVDDLDDDGDGVEDDDDDDDDGDGVPDDEEGGEEGGGEEGGGEEGGGEEGGGLTGNGTGTLTDDSIKLTWWWDGDAQWEQGTCVRLQFQNTGEDLAKWEATLDIRPSVESWLDGGSGATATLALIGDDTIQVLPNDLTLDAGEIMEVTYCAEPYTEPYNLEVLSELTDPEDTEDPDDDDEEDALRGSIKTADQKWGLMYEEAGVSNGGTCLDLTFVNLSGEDVIDWTATVTLEDEGEVTNSWNVDSYTFGSSDLFVIPNDAGKEIDNYRSYTGTVCLDPASEPVAIEVDWTTEDEEEEGEEGEEGEGAPSLYGSLLSDDGGWGLAWTDGGIIDELQCLELTVVNLTDDDATDWRAEVALDGAADLGHTWTLEAYTFGTDSLILQPEEWTEPGLDAGDSVSGGVCFDPLVLPTGMVVEWSTDE